jgi:hypothetical protein
VRLHTGKKWEAQKFAAFILHVHSADRVVSVHEEGASVHAEGASEEGASVHEEGVSVHEEGASVHEEGYVKGKTEATCNMANIMVTSF